MRHRASQLAFPGADVQLEVSPGTAVRCRADVESAEIDQHQRDNGQRCDGESRVETYQAAGLGGAGSTLTDARAARP